MKRMQNLEARLAGRADRVLGLVSLTSRDKVTYSDAIACLEIDLKAAKSKEVKMGIAKVTEGDKFIRVTWSK